MDDKPIIITDIVQVKFDELTPGRAFIPTRPREYHALAYILEGNLRYTCGSAVSELTPGEVLFIKAGHVDLAECTSAVSVKYVLFDFDTLDSDFDLRSRFSPDERSGNLLESFTKAQRCFKGRESGYKMECIEILYGILNRLLRSVDEKAYKYRRIAPAVELLEAQLSDPTLTPAKLAAVCEIGAGRLNTIMRQLHGVTTSQFISQRRMENACTLLRNQELGIGDVAAKCGYSDIYAFSHAFRRAFGASPTEWRRK